ncbi:MAG: hypothetical protein V3R32_03545 [Nitrosomonadaceae bacterium]
MSAFDPLQPVSYWSWKGSWRSEKTFLVEEKGFESVRILMS